MRAAGLALGTLIASAATALAGGEVVYGTVLRQPGTAVPVPAPAPMPEVSTGWYVRIDAAYGQSDVSKFRSTDPFADGLRADSKLDNFGRYGLGVGYYINNWLRADITFDHRDDTRSRGRGTRSYGVPNTAGGLDGNGNPLPASIAMRDTYADNFISSDTTGMINLYAERAVTPSLTPYVGLGIGFVRYQLKGRTFSKATNCVDTLDCDPTTVGAQAGATNLNTSFTAAGGGVDYALATAAMAGFSYKIHDNIKLDMGYRYLNLQGTTWVGRSTGPVHNLTLPAQNVHELRAGVRFDVN